MAQFFSAASRFFTCLAIALLLVGALTVPNQSAFADDPVGGNDGFGSCQPNPSSDPCDLNSNGQGNCPGLGCVSADGRTGCTCKLTGAICGCP